LKDRPYPDVMTEEQTINLLPTHSIARFGDGEWRCAIGGGCTSQRPDANLARELKQVLISRMPSLVVGLPHLRGPRAESWERYSEPRYVLNTERGWIYGSAFITRPDNAPWIDTPEFWAKVRALWKGRDVILVVGDKKSITEEMIANDAASISHVWGPRQHAYAEIDRLEARVLELDPTAESTVLLCLGATATVLAWRLAKRGYHALDLGHIGMFMRHAGAYRYGLEDVISDAYRRQLEKLHARERWGADGAKHADAVDAIAAEMTAVTVLDYGCGENRLAEALKDRRRVSGYDPGIPMRNKMPKPCDLVVCTDVLEHVEPEKLDAVLDHIYRLSARKAYLVIATRPANAILPDGRNAHLIVEQAPWWLGKLEKLGWRIERSETTGKELRTLLQKPRA
jgi:hypothetical protein